MVVASAKLRALPRDPRGEPTDRELLSALADNQSWAARVIWDKFHPGVHGFLRRALISFRWLKDKNPEFDGQAPAGELGGGAIRSHHNLAHHDSGELKNYSDQWFIEQYAYLMDRLAEATDADGRPLIETTVVLYCNMQKSGGGHETQDLFWLMGGNYDGYFKTGRYLRWPSGKDGTSIPQNQVLTSIINGAGCPHLEFFGDAQYGGELALLRG